MTSDTEHIAHHHQAAQAAMAQRQYRQAHQHCLAVLQRDRQHADAWFFCGIIAAHNGQLAKAIEIFGTAIGLAPQRAEYRAELGKHLIAQRQPERALIEAQEAFALKPADIPTLNTLGTIFSHVGEHEQALLCYDKASQLLDKKAQTDQLSITWKANFYFNVATSQQFAGQFEAAEKSYEQALECNARLFKAHSALAQLKRQTPDNNHLERLNHLRTNVESPREQLHLGHALAKEQEDLGLYAEALASLQWGKQAQARQVNFSAANEEKLFAAIKQQFNSQRFDQIPQGEQSREPIFIVGMPRTGTTLLEQILSAHSQVFAAGELQHFPLLVKRLTQSPSSEDLDIPTIELTTQLDVGQLGKAYIDSTRPRTGHVPHFIDKLPLNFMHLGLIHCALPNAKLVCLRRDPMDTCLSNYRQLFGANFKRYQYNLDLLDCGRYFIEFDALMSHWQNVMPGKVHEVVYEDLVEDSERVVRSLLSYCELPWEAQCMSFHQRKSSVATPSAVQVRQGIYTSSVGRWRRYGEAMQPLYELLQSAGLYS